MNSQNTVFSESAACRLNQVRTDTKIVGLATTTETATSARIKSLQVLYFSTDDFVCSCLRQDPTIIEELTEKEIEPYEGNDVIGMLAADGYLDQVIYGTAVFIVSVFLFSLGFLAYMCHRVRAERPTKLAFTEEKYLDMIRKNEDRDRDLDKMYQNLV